MLKTNISSNLISKKILSGAEICIDLVEVLQNRLNDALLDGLTSMLYRNPVCKLYPDDVYYIQPYDDHADNSMKVTHFTPYVIFKLNLTQHFTTILKSF